MCKWRYIKKELLSNSSVTGFGFDLLYYTSFINILIEDAHVPSYMVGLSTFNYVYFENLSIINSTCGIYTNNSNKESNRAACVLFSTIESDLTITQNDTNINNDAWVYNLEIVDSLFTNIYYACNSIIFFETSGNFTFLIENVVISNSDRKVNTTRTDDSNNGLIVIAPIEPESDQQIQNVIINNCRFEKNYNWSAIVICLNGSYCNVTVLILWI